MELTTANPSMGDVVLDTDLMLSSLSHYDAWKDGFAQLLSLTDIPGLFAIAEALVLNQWPMLRRKETVAELVRARALAQDRVCDGL